MRSFIGLTVLFFAATACSSTPDDQGADVASSSEATTGTGGAGGHGGSTTSSTGGGGHGPTGDVQGPVKSYDYDFDLATAHAKAKVTIDPVSTPGNCYKIPFALTAATNETWNGKPATGSPSGGNLDLCGDSITAGPLVIGADADVPSKTFFGTDVGYSKLQDLAGGTFTYLLSWVGGCDRFGPCDDDPSRLNEFHITVQHSNNDVVLCPGTLTPGTTSTKCDLTGTLAPTYSAFALASDPLWKKSMFLSGSPNVVFYEVPGGKVASSIDSKSYQDYLTWIQGLLGPFPYGSELRLAGAPTYWLGFEHPANIILQEHLETATGAYLNPSQHVLMHETAHQWSGDRATIATALDFVWKEATVEYLSYVFEDEQRPVGEAAASLQYWDSVSLQSLHYPRPTDKPAPTVQSFYGDVYGPGPMVLYVQLETMLGRQAVLDSIKAFLAQAGAKSVDDLEKAFETTTGKDLKPYFQAWVFGTGVPEWPTFSISTQPMGGNQVQVTATQQNKSKIIYPCKFNIKVDTAGQSATATIDFGLNPMSTSAQTVVNLTGAVTNTTLDPEHRLVARDAAKPVANPHPIKVWIL